MKTENGIPVIEISNNVIYNKRTRTFIAEISEVDAVADSSVYLLNPKTKVQILFDFVRKDESKSEQEIYGWHYASRNKDLNLKFLLIND